MFKNYSTAKLRQSFGASNKINIYDFIIFFSVYLFDFQKDDMDHSEKLLKF